MGDEEVEKLYCLYAELYSLSRINTSICWQRSCLNWLSEGDANFKYFHGTMSRWRRVNAITSIYVGGVQVEGVCNVTEAIFSHFAYHFKDLNMSCSRATKFNFHTLNYWEGAALIRPFCLEEVEAAVWDCDSFNCPSPDGVNFGFIKDL